MQFKPGPSTSTPIDVVHEAIAENPDRILRLVVRDAGMVEGVVKFFSDELLQVRQTAAMGDDQNNPIPLHVDAYVRAEDVVMTCVLERMDGPDLKTASGVIPGRHVIAPAYS